MEARKIIRKPLRPPLPIPHGADEGWSQLPGAEIEARSFIRKPLRPPLPICLKSDKAPLLNFWAEGMDGDEEINNLFSLGCCIGQKNGIPKDPVIPEPPETTQKTPTKIKPGWSPLPSEEMKARTFIRKPLRPPQPIHHGAGKAPLLHLRAESMDDNKDIKDQFSLGCSVGQQNGILKDPAFLEPPKTKIEQGCIQPPGMEMDVRKPLRPPQPINLGADRAAGMIPDRPALTVMCQVTAPLLNFQAKSMDCCKEEVKDHYSLGASVGQRNGILKDPIIIEPPETLQKATRIKEDRITYSRDFLLQLSSLPSSRQKPKYLPEHPIVLDDPLCDLYELPLYIQQRPCKENRSGYPVTKTKTREKEIIWAI